MKATYVLYKDKVCLLSDLAKEHGLLPRVVYARYIQRGWDLEKALTVPVKQQEAFIYKYKGKDYTVAELTKMHGAVSVDCMRARLKVMSVEEAVTKPNTHPTRKKRITEKKQKETCKPIPRRRNLEQCRTCQYHGTFGAGGSIYCDYIEIELQRRPCPPSPDCTVYVKGPSLVRKTALKRYKHL